MRTDYDKLPPQRRKVMDFILAEIAAGRAFPSREQIRAHMGWKKLGSVTDVLMMLSGEGFMMRWREDATKNQRAHFRFGLPVEAPKQEKTTWL